MRSGGFASATVLGFGASDPPHPASARSAATARAARRTPSGLRCAEGERELAALSWTARDPDPAAVLGDDALADRQPDAGARIRLLAVEALERFEDPLGVLGVHPDAVVTDPHAPHVAVAVGADLDLGRAAGDAELDSVADEGLQDTAHAGAVDAHDREVVHVHVRVRLLDRARERLERAQIGR